MVAEGQVAEARMQGEINLIKVRVDVVAQEVIALLRSRGGALPQ